MPHYIRVLGETNPAIPVTKLRDYLREQNLKATLEVDDGDEEDWTTLLVKDAKDRDIILIEKNIVLEGELGEEEIEEFQEEVLDYKPTSAATWLTEYLNEVKVIYAFQILNSVDNEENWSIVGELKSMIWQSTKGIIQADHEGFSNREGYHILWQFRDDVSGEWSMAVNDIHGHWTKFIMDLGDPAQREEFWNGKVPKGARKIE
ncbi:hypothetical protein SAMN04488109_0877 [Chryseolinea serpens]|uniref:Uncharacterized protein n=1 Tax=Chryseolinea serpens TaxID=947013 RepID=A0A1M5KW54_9BACT|nr:hypothetical protein [Chryseolinea serpens]SHG57044.1 hypothetical protein SAMN04488109_0877 [Chryseolinea serpens]